MLEMRECPFCGSGNIKISYQGGRLYWAHCNGGEAEGPPELTPGKAEAAWNTRQATPAEEK